MPEPEPLDLTQVIALSLTKVVAITGISRGQLYKYMAAGRLKTYRNGRRRLVDAQSLRQLLDELHDTER